VYGARPWRGPPATRLAALVLGLAAGSALLAAADAPWSLAVVLLAMGLLLGPTTVVCSALLDTAAPEGTVTEAFAVMVMGLVAGTAAGNAIGGAIVEEGSYRTAALAAAVIAALGAGWAVARRSALAA
jgi:MFS family permease